MAIHYYLSMTPESLVASTLRPEEFGTYMATGTKKRSRGRALYFDLKSGFRSDDFDFAMAEARCVPRPDGTPKHSVYLSIYRVMERIPLSALNSLWLATRDGRVLELKQAPTPDSFPGRLHLYEELCPVHPLIVSSLMPTEFCSSITALRQPVAVPRIALVDLQLGKLAFDPGHGDAGDLPYEHADHLRDCLLSLSDVTGKRSKMVNRTPSEDFPWRCVKSGFFVGDPGGTLYYPWPSPEEFEDKYHDWWRSATTE